MPMRIRVRKDTGLEQGMEHDVALLIARLLDERGYNQTTLAAALEVSQSTVSRWVKGSEPDLSAISKIVSLATKEGLIGPTARATIPVVGWVGAGETGHYYGYGDGDNNVILAPRYSTARTVALKIDGDSLGPILKGWYVVYDERRDPPTDDLLGELCVVATTDGQVLVKTLRRGAEPGTFDLYPQFGSPILGAKLEWAAVVLGFERGNRT